LKSILIKIRKFLRNRTSGAPKGVPSVEGDVNTEGQVKSADLSEEDKSKLKKLSDENQGTDKAILWMNL